MCTRQNSEEEATIFQKAQLKHIAVHLQFAPANMGWNYATENHVAKLEVCW